MFNEDDLRKAFGEAPPAYKIDRPSAINYRTVTLPSFVDCDFTVNFDKADVIKFTFNNPNVSITEHHIVHWRQQDYPVNTEFPLITDIAKQFNMPTGLSNWFIVNFESMNSCMTYLYTSGFKKEVKSEEEVVNFFLKEKNITQEDYDKLMSVYGQTMKNNDSQKAHEEQTISEIKKWMLSTADYKIASYK